MTTLPVSPFTAAGEMGVSGDSSFCATATVVLAALTAGLFFLLVVPADLTLPGDGSPTLCGSCVSTCTAILGDTLCDLLELDPRALGALPKSK